MLRNCHMIRSTYACVIERNFNTEKKQAKWAEKSVAAGMNNTHLVRVNGAERLLVLIGRHNLKRWSAAYMQRMTTKNARFYDSTWTKRQSCRFMTGLFVLAPALFYAETPSAEGASRCLGFLGVLNPQKPLKS